MHLRRLALVVFFSGYLLLQPSSHKVNAVVVETAEECASIYVDAAENLSTSTYIYPLKQVFYPPRQTTVTNFIATCIGSTELPEITDNNGYPLESIDRFTSDDCGRVSTNSCCMIDPSPGELFCNILRYARCNLFHSPEKPYQITCKEGILRVLTPSSSTLVLEDAEKDGYYMHFSGYDTPVMEQPDGSLRFSPKADDGSTRVIVARPWDLGAPRRAAQRLRNLARRNARSIATP